MNFEDFRSLESLLTDDFAQLSAIQKKIMWRLDEFADGKKLKGNEIVGCLGEVYTKMIFSGALVDDSCEHDVEAENGMRISVKTRKGRNSGWNITSAIPKIDGENTPTHLVFVNLKSNYQVHKIWLFTWSELGDDNRFRKHVVRGNLRSYIVRIDEKKDHGNLVYESE